MSKPSALPGVLAYFSSRWQTLLTYRTSMLLAALGAPLCYITLVTWGVPDSVSRHLVTPGQSYAAFASIGMMVGVSATTAAGYGMWPVASGFRGSRRYLTAIRASLTPTDVVLGEWLAVMARMAIQSGGYILIGFLLGVWHSPTLMVRAWAGAILGSSAMDAVAGALTMWWPHAHRYFFAIDKMLLVPLMMLSGTWCAIETLPAALQACAPLSPIWHAAQAARGGPLWHAGLLIALSVAGLALQAIAMDRRTLR